MPLPPAVGTCTLSGQFEVLPGAAANTGSITFTLPTPLYDTADHIILSAAVYTAVLDAGGTFSIALPYNDNPGVTPTGWSYLVTENLIGGREPYYIQITRSLGANATLDEIAQSPIPSGPVFPQPWIPSAVVQGKGDLLAGSAPGAVVHVPVGADGLVLTAAAAQPGGIAWTAAAGGGAVASVNGQTGVVILGAADVAALATAQNLADVPSPSAARTSLGLGSSATRAVGTAAGTVAAGDDARIIAAAQGSRDQHAAKLGALIESFPIEACNNLGLGLSSGDLICSLGRPSAAAPAWGVAMWLIAAGSGSSGPAYVALLDEAGHELAISADVSATFTSLANENTIIELPFVSSVALSLDQSYYLSVLTQMSSIPKVAGSLVPAGTLQIPAVRGHRPSVFVGGLTAVPSTVNIASASTAFAAYWMAALPAPS